MVCALENNGEKNDSVAEQNAPTAAVTMEDFVNNGDFANYGLKREIYISEIVKKWNENGLMAGRTEKFGLKYLGTMIAAGPDGELEGFHAYNYKLNIQNDGGEVNDLVGFNLQIVSDDNDDNVHYVSICYYGEEMDIDNYGMLTILSIPIVQLATGESWADSADIVYAAQDIGVEYDKNISTSDYVISSSTSSNVLTFIIQDVDYYLLKWDEEVMDDAVVSYDNYQ